MEPKFAPAAGTPTLAQTLLMMDVVKFRGQDYTSLRKKGQSSGILFVDPSFPADRKSIWLSAEGGASHEFEVVWKRPKVSS